MTSEADGERLVQLARDVIAHELGGPPPVRPTGPWFEAPSATFVTVTRLGQLHGCIGSIAPHRPLAEDVASNAVAAAFMDPRSPRFHPDWLPELGVEVTLLSPLTRMTFTSEADLLSQLVPFEDGLVLRYGYQRGTFLPQVWNNLPDPREFLEELKRKAGMVPGFWAEGVEVDRFRVQKWGDRRAPCARPEVPS